MRRMLTAGQMGLMTGSQPWLGAGRRRPCSLNGVLAVLNSMAWEPETRAVRALPSAGGSKPPASAPCLAGGGGTNSSVMSAHRAAYASPRSGRKRRSRRLEGVAGPRHRRAAADTGPRLPVWWGDRHAWRRRPAARRALRGVWADLDGGRSRRSVRGAGAAGGPPGPYPYDRRASVPPRALRR